MNQCCSYFNKMQKHPTSLPHPLSEAQFIGIRMSSKYPPLFQSLFYGIFLNTFKKKKNSAFPLFLPALLSLCDFGSSKKGSYLHPLHLKCGILTTEPRRKSQHFALKKGISTCFNNWIKIQKKIFTLRKKTEIKGSFQHLPWNELSHYSGSLHPKQREWCHQVPFQGTTPKISVTSHHSFDSCLYALMFFLNLFCASIRENVSL